MYYESNDLITHFDLEYAIMLNASMASVHWTLYPDYAINTSHYGLSSISQVS